MLIAHKYRLVRVLSQGGMGSVWVAHNELLDVQVALKLIRHDLRTAGLAERLITEARLAARLEHPAVVSVHDVDNTERGDPYIVMELLRGEDLRQLIERERQLDPERAVQWLLPIVEGLVAAHAHGIVHRDLKPENIYFTHVEERIQPKIVDFGIAKPEAAEPHRGATHAGAVVGSPDYMAPEQARAVEDVDHRADIWAFAVVLYECLTGRAPFADSAYESLLRDIVHERIVPITERGVNEPALWAILERALAKSRDERWQSAREMGVALAQWLRTRGIDEDVCCQSLRAMWLRESDPPRDSATSAFALVVPHTLRPVPTPRAASSSGVVCTRAASATLPSQTGELSDVSPRSEPQRSKPARKVSRGTAIASGFVLSAIVATLVVGVATAAASPPFELLAWYLADAVPPARWAVDELETSSALDVTFVDDLPAEEPSIDLDGSDRQIKSRTVARRRAGVIRHPARAIGTAQRTSSPTSAAPAATSPQREWTSFAAMDLGF